MAKKIQQIWIRYIIGKVLVIFGESRTMKNVLVTKILKISYCEYLCLYSF